MIHITIAAAIALTAGATAAEAHPSGPRAVVTATWHPARGPGGSYGVRASHLEAAAITGSRIYQRTCRAERAWREMGVTNARRLRTG